VCCAGIIDEEESPGKQSELFITDVVITIVSYPTAVDLLFMHLPAAASFTSPSYFTSDTSMSKMSKMSKMADRSFERDLKHSGDGSYNRTI
jgi:hypothetical protein